MRTNIIFLYIIYILIVCLLFIIDNTILMYYIFWVNNIFIYPLIWIWIKILYYNRTVLLLLLFYYLIAKYTIKQSGYKYFYFFNIDIRKVQLIYWNYIWNITTYHIEMLSIFLFFFVIILPLALHSKEIIFLMCCLILFLFLWIRVFKNRLKYIKEKKIRLRSLIFFSLALLVFIKMFNYHYIKDFYTMYVYLDKWTFELLEWKIQMYNKTIERDYYAETVGLKPKWVSEKINIKEKSDHKLWDYLFKKKKNNFINELKYKLKRTKKKYYLYIKYHERALEVKNGQALNKIEKLRKDIVLKDLIYFKKKINKVNIKEYTPPVNTKKENPVVTQEKEKERALHRSIVSNLILKFSISNYYSLNTLLKEFTSNKLYYQPFIDKKGGQKHIIEVKNNNLYISMKERLNLKEDIIFFKKIIGKIKKNKSFVNSIKNIENYEKRTFFIEKCLDYLFLDKKNKNIKDFLLKFLKNKENEKIKKKEKLNIKKFLIYIKNDIKNKSKLNKLFFFYESKNNILNKDKLEEKKKAYLSFSKYTEKKKLEKTDNELLYKKVKKYNEEATKAGWKNEFSDVFVLEKKKDNLTMTDSPDLSRRNKK